MEAAIWGMVALLFVSGGILIVIGIKQRAGTLRRNYLVGLRTDATLASDEAWHAAHTATARLMIVAGGVPILGALALVVWQPDEPLATNVILGSIALMVLLVVVGGIRGHGIAVRVNEDEPTRPSDRASG